MAKQLRGAARAAAGGWWEEWHEDWKEEMEEFWDDIRESWSLKTIEAEKSAITDPGVDKGPGGQTIGGNLAIKERA